MAIVKVINEFTDKHTGELHNVGEEFEADEGRIDEIMKVSKHLIEIQKAVEVSEPDEIIKVSKKKKKEK